MAIISATVDAYWHHRVGADANGIPVLAKTRTRSTLYPPAVWRRLAATQGDDAAFEGLLRDLGRSESPEDAQVIAELLVLQNELDDQIEDRGQRILALGRLVPDSSDVHDALNRAGLSWPDTGLPEGFTFDQPWLPLDLANAKQLLTWLLAHRPSLPRP